MNVELLEDIEDTSKKNAKVELLKNADEQTRRLITLAVDQNITFGVTVDEEEAVTWWETSIRKTKPEIWWNKNESFLVDDLATRNMTGNAALAEVRATCEHAPSELDLKWFCRILNRNLRAGFDRSTCNKAWGDDAVKKFEVQLADAYEAQELDGEWIFEPKLDGNRVVGYKGQPTSRGNKIYPAAQPIFDDLRKINGFLDEFVPDGEMMGNLGFDKSSGALRRTTGKGEKADFVYWIFDLFTKKEYDSQITASLRDRKTRLKNVFVNYKFPENVKMVPWTVVKNPTHKQIMEITQDFVKAGFEGAMAKRLDAPAKFGRGPNLLKVKLFFEDDFKVVDFYEGKGQHKGSLGGLIVEGTIKWAPSPGMKKETYKIRSEVGSGFGHKADPDDPTKVLRQDVWKNKKDWLGAIVQVQFQEPTKKEKDGFKSLRLPVFIMRRKDKE
jgi:ATP-dependent DNA ligase